MDAESLLLKLHEEGKAAVVIVFDGQTVIVHCQREDDVAPLCRAVLAADDAPRVLN